ncbi:MAG: rhodanese-like domain-containing protein [Cyclobacteriaceae bacterium]|nr:rhodanese-like domain-containing protein [Cyclobacteriaceae bacterium]
MIQQLKEMLGIGPEADFAELVKNGATIVDVRTKGEYAGGHIKGSINIPLDQLESKLGQLKKDKAIITCCASGMRSSSAKSILKSHGFENVHNGGGWGNLNYKLK